MFVEESSIIANLRMWEICANYLFIAKSLPFLFKSIPHEINERQRPELCNISFSFFIIRNEKLYFP